ncbi:hypothetical protein FACS1894179_09030 [Bacteroidia bacterium]|nr:hypothetical protein FACS1894169_12350 [Bacteroidia bacterium]GHV41248.1 hypothetical protein FACS1894179_09030 [Bacteroidia bacterium]
MEKQYHKGLTITFWVVAAILGIHYIFIYLPHAVDKGIFSIGSLIIPAIILLVIWLLKRNAEKKLNGNTPEKQLEDNPKNGYTSSTQHQVKEQTLDNTLKEFSRQFTEEQKTIIIWFLVKIANSDGDANAKEEQQLSQIMELLDYDMSNTKIQAIALTVAEYPVSKLNEIVLTLDTSLREWFVITAFSLIVCDGEVKDKEIESSVYYSSIFGFSVEEHDEIIKKATALYGNFNKK